MVSILQDISVAGDRAIRLDVGFMINFQDFAPRPGPLPGFFQQRSFEPLRDALARANQWIETHQIEPVTIETVVLPNTLGYQEEGPEDPSLHVSGKAPSTWNQFIRIWYHSP